MSLKLKMKLIALLMVMAAMVMAAKQKVMDTSANVMAVVGFIAVAIILVIGIVILSAVVGAINTTANSSFVLGPFYSIYLTLVTTIGSGYGIMAIVLLVIAAVTIMGYLMSITGGRR